MTTEPSALPAIAAQRLDVPAELPIAAHADEIVRLLRTHQVVVVAGETGSGKTTQLPKLALRAGLGEQGIIGHTQPRRLAARAVASRIADELGVELGDAVGFAVRFSDQTSDRTRVKVMTDGLLLAEIPRDRDLKRYSVLIIDEAHERSLNIDFLLGYLKRLTERRRDLKIVITSATIDVAAFAQHFDAPVVEVSGRGYPVTVEYLEDDLPLADLVLECVARMEQRKPAINARDALVFLPGERDIFALSRDLKSRLSDRWELLPLYARLPASEQQRVFRPGSRRRLVLSTNVAETSLTVPNIGYVIDAGLARISRYSYRSKLQRLPIEPISQASANQRTGRCGRLAPGVCFRLYGEADFLGRPEFTDPEMQRSNLAAVLLQMLVFGFGRMDQFPFLDPPEPGAVRAAAKLLEELEATRDGRVTEIGRKLARLPVDPRLARMLLEAQQRGALQELLIIVAGMAGQDPRERPPGAQGAADEAHAQWVDGASEFDAWVKLWQVAEGQRGDLTRRKYERWLKAQFLSVNRMREWRELHRQLKLAAQGLKLHFNANPADYEAVHRSILAGSLSFVGHHLEKGRYEGPGGLRFRVFPGSVLHGKAGKWLEAAEIAETKAVYARTVASIEPRWLEEQARHLLKRQHFEPHYAAKRGEAVCFEKVSLRGLVLVEKRRVSYAPIDRDHARSLFIVEGLVAGALPRTPPVIAGNLKVVQQVLAEEAKLRRRDLLIAPEEQAAWYDERIPADVLSLRTLEGWLKRRPENAQQLTWQEQDLKTQTVVGLADFPSELELGDQRVRIRYRFAPGEPDDGATVELPIGLMNGVPEEALQWSVPGYFEVVCEQWLKSLPKQHRKRLAPLADKIPRVAERLLDPRRYRSGQLALALARTVAELYDVRIDPTAFNAEQVDPHLTFNVRLIDSRRRIIAEGRDFLALRQAYQRKLAAEVDRDRPPAFVQSGLAEYPRTLSLPSEVVVQRGGSEMLLYPGFVDQGQTVAIEAFPNRSDALTASHSGLARLALLAMAPAVRKLRRRLQDDRTLQLHYASLGGREQLEQDALLGMGWHCYFDGRDWPANRAVFDALLQTGGPLAAYAERWIEAARNLLAARFELVRTLDEQQSPAYAAAVADVRRLLERLVPPSVLRSVGIDGLAQRTRYLEAQRLRLAGLQGKVQRDAEQQALLGGFEERLQSITGRPECTPAQAQELFEALEELRVALYAEKLRASKVSPKRLERSFEATELALGLR
ncbi:MAG: ATP-dependent RNA helicase HrpA [Pseudomonadota bacterium]